MRREEATTLHARGPRPADHRRSGMGRFRLGALIVICAVSATNLGVAADEVPQEFRDAFETPGSLASTRATDPWEVSGGVWTVTDADLTSSNPATASNRVLVQGSKAATPNDPIAFVRSKSFREVTAEVTIAFMDPLDRFGTLPQGASAGLVFRAPIDEGSADRDNLYLFSAFSTGVQRDFPTGKAIGLFKRVARGYTLVGHKIVHTWADLTRPHRYKVVMGRGRVRAYFDNRLIIDHTDLPNGDTPNPLGPDPFPGLPFDQGAVGLRTSATRAWFDDFVVVGNDAYEGRAFATDVYSQTGESTQVRRGDAVTLSQIGQTFDLDKLDTGYAYGAAELDAFAVRALENPFNPDSEFGGTVRTESKDGAAISTVRLTGGEVFVREPVNRSISMTLVTKGVETVATASCEQASSRVVFTETNLYIEVRNDPVLPDLTIGPIPFATEYPPNTIIYERPGIITVTAHPQVVTTAPYRVEAAALRITIPDGGIIGSEPQNIPVQNVTTVRLPGTSTPIPPFEYTLAGVTAGRYCR